MDRDNLRNEVLDCGRRARAATRSLARMSTERKNAALLAMDRQTLRWLAFSLGVDAADAEPASTE